MKKFLPRYGVEHEKRVANEQLESHRLISRQHSLKLLQQAEGEKQIIVHCKVLPGADTSIIGPLRIWPSIYLIDKEHDYKSKLLAAWNITLYPEWELVPFYKKSHEFTLVFSALHPDCRHFDLIEDIPDDGGFIQHNIPRNNLGVYELEL